MSSPRWTYLESRISLSWRYIFSHRHLSQHALIRVLKLFRGLCWLISLGGLHGGCWSLLWASCTGSQLLHEYRCDVSGLYMVIDLLMLSLMAYKCMCFFSVLVSQSQLCIVSNDVEYWIENPMQLKVYEKLKHSRPSRSQNEVIISGGRMIQIIYLSSNNTPKVLHYKYKSYMQNCMQV